MVSSVLFEQQPSRATSLPSSTTNDVHSTRPKRMPKSVAGGAFVDHEYKPEKNHHYRQHPHQDVWWYKGHRTNPTGHLTQPGSSRKSQLDERSNRPLFCHENARSKPLTNARHSGRYHLDRSASFRHTNTSNSTTTTTSSPNNEPYTPIRSFSSRSLLGSSSSSLSSSLLSDHNQPPTWKKKNGLYKRDDDDDEEEEEEDPTEDMTETEEDSSCSDHSSFLKEDYKIREQSLPTATIPQPAPSIRSNRPLYGSSSSNNNNTVSQSSPRRRLSPGRLAVFRCESSRELTLHKGSVTSGRNPTSGGGGDLRRSHSPLHSRSVVVGNQGYASRSLVSDLSQRSLPRLSNSMTMSTNTKPDSSLTTTTTTTRSNNKVKRGGTYGYYRSSSSTLLQEPPQSQDPNANDIELPTKTVPAQGSKPFQSVLPDKKEDNDNKDQDKDEVASTRTFATKYLHKPVTTSSPIGSSQPSEKETQRRALRARLNRAKAVLQGSHLDPHTNENTELSITNHRSSSRTLVMEEQHTHQDNKTREEKQLTPAQRRQLTYQWYMRNRMPTRTSMLERIHQTGGGVGGLWSGGICLTEHDVHSLPWMRNGAIVDATAMIAHMNDLYVCSGGSTRSLMEL